MIGLIHAFCTDRSSFRPAESCAYLLHEAINLEDGKLFHCRHVSAQEFWSVTVLEIEACCVCATPRIDNRCISEIQRLVSGDCDRVYRREASDLRLAESG